MEAERAGEDRRTGIVGRGATALLRLVVVCAVLAVLAPIAFVALLFLAGVMGDSPERGDPPEGSFALDAVPVEVAPTEGLVEGSRVTVSSEAFRPLGVVRVMPCVLDAEGEIDQCDGLLAQRFAVPADGHLRVELTVSRVATGVGGAVDCAERPGRCALLAAAVADRTVSGAAVLTFAEDIEPLVPEPTDDPPPLDPLTATLVPPAPVPAGDTRTVTAPGFVPGEPVEAGLCLADDLGSRRGLDDCEPLADDAVAFGRQDVDEVPGDAQLAGLDGVATLPVELPASLRRNGRRIDCADPSSSCVVVVVAVADRQRLAVAPVVAGG